MSIYENNPDHLFFKVFYLSEVKGSLNNLGHVKGLKDRDDFGKPLEFEF